MTNYSQLKSVLNDMFELNKADLDFGIYRIINQKRKQVNDFIERQLPEDIKNTLAGTQSADQAELSREIADIGRQLDGLGIVKEENPKYIAKKQQLENLQNSEAMEQEVFSHLTAFFRRYYKDGDFISMRRYKKDVYAIPYEGEEVKLHWANHDQYYIKSSENFKNYTFRTPDGKSVVFHLKEVSTEQNNNKAQDGQERRFAVYADLPVEESEDGLHLNFIYEPFPKAVKQDALMAEALQKFSENIPAEYTSLFSLAPTEKNAKRTLLEKHLNAYISKNSFDYFIHKDLGGFLSRELDFYIKNEVLYLDDINTQQTDFFVAQLSKVKAIKEVAGKIIEFLAQIENFQKKLWLKKKFVVRTDWLVTMDRVPEKFHAEIFTNKAQAEEWKSLFDVEVRNEQELVFETSAVLDTRFFPEEFKDRLLAEFEDLDENTNGLLINSENFQALNLLQEKYQEKVDTVYIDPPYNSPSSEIAYKNSFKHSSWSTLIKNRLDLSNSLLNTIGNHIIAIDENEQNNLFRIVTETFPSEFYDNTIISIEHNKKGIQGGHFSYSSEFAIFSIPYSLKKINRIKVEKKNWEWSNLRNWGSESLRSDAKNCFYPIIIENDKIIKIGEVCTDDFHPQSSNISEGTTTIIYPIDNEGIERKWRYAQDTVQDILEKLKVVNEADGKKNIQIAKIDRPFKSMWYDTRHNAGDNGTKILTSMGFKKGSFDFPKSVYLVYDCLYVSDRPNNLIIDFFAGSATTGHATIKLNREDGGNRKYILVEMGTYFNTVTKPRIAKVIYSDSWKSGKPQDKNGISQLVKYQMLESYEDTLNNLALADRAELDFGAAAQEEYLLKYMLEMESRDNLFNLEMFRKPFSCQLKITENNELVPTKIDLVETFNYLIGLYVSKMQRVKDIKVVEGVTRTGIKTLVIWRDMETTTHDDLAKLLRRFYDSQRTAEFQQIYINGDHHLENLRSDADIFKIKLIEETFYKKMFNEAEL